MKNIPLSVINMVREANRQANREECARENHDQSPGIRSHYRFGKILYVCAGCRVTVAFARDL